MSAVVTSCPGDYPPHVPPSPAPTDRDAVVSAHTLLRQLRPLLDAVTTDGALRAGALERLAGRGDPPTVAHCTRLEAGGGRPVPTATHVGVDAFLDGIQRTRVIGHLGTTPLLFATVAAVVRVRADRQLTTWEAPRLRHLVLAARAQVGEARWEALGATGVELIDVAEADDANLVGHPLAVRARALDQVGLQREALERALAAAWCRTESRWLWVDGGISGNLAIDAHATAFGVVKSHSTLYGDAALLHTTLTLAAGERGPVFLVQHRGRRAVASWYLRVHGSSDGDPLHGLVRVEVAPPDTLRLLPDGQLDAAATVAVPMLAARADHLSSWIRADRAPLALPDPRWPTLTYGVAACEQYLNALIGS